MSGRRPEKRERGEGGVEECVCVCVEGVFSQQAPSDRGRVTQTSLTSVCLCVCVDIQGSMWGWLMRGRE